MATPRTSRTAGSKAGKAEAAAEAKPTGPGPGMVEAVQIFTALTLVAAIIVMDMYSAAAFGKGVFF